MSSFDASASAGQTNAASSSRSTAAAQRDDEEAVDEVDEVAFQNLKNYDQNPQGILLPEDQSFAYDDKGNVYLIVTLAGQHHKTAPESFTVFKVELDPDLQANTQTVSPVPADDEFAYTYRPEFMRLASANGED